MKILLYVRIFQFKLSSDCWNLGSLINLVYNTIESCIFTLLSTKPEFSTAINLSIANKHTRIAWSLFPEKIKEVLIGLCPK